ncbi:GNAT family N-acetyltransferase [Actinomadura rubrisoli]|uniref:GNAT family N-acetyltransferase n=2 Tax=Actinomadura rubrisoli TaxID=2530368 RepID=A0A4R5BL44_9ACTN|nr:GNAT family N-acetyltransferase [Actinomadura rubrisoli]
MQTEMEIRYADRIEALAAAAADLHATLDVDEGQVAYVGLAYAGGEPVGHAALRRLGGDLELKRMYVAAAHRGTGVSTALLAATEDAARALGARRVILQTGDRQPDAVRLYEREGYARIPVFPPYEWLTFSICMEKVL